jgi:hypothetical protein
VPLHKGTWRKSIHLVINFIQTRFANERILDSIEAPAAAGMQTGIFPNARPGFHALIVDTVGLERR